MGVLVVIEARPTKRATIAAIYAAVGAPKSAAPNLDGLADILRDLSWREPEPLTLEWQVSPALPGGDLSAIHDVLAAAVVESALGRNPLRLRVIT
jgi:hypothetical protein